MMSRVCALGHSVVVSGVGINTPRLDVIRLAAAGGWDTHAWQFPVVLEEYLDRRGHRHDCREALRTALTAAQNMDNWQGQAYVHYGLGRVFHWFGDFEKAGEHLKRALDFCEKVDEEALKAHAHVEYSHVFEHQKRLAHALDHAQCALDLARTVGSRRAEARALFFSGKYHALLGDYGQALSYSQQALILNREIGDRRSEGYTLNGIGYAYQGLGQYEQAIAYYEQELALQSELADRYSQAVTFNLLGDTHQAAGNEDAARQAWQQALRILEDFGTVDVGHVRTEQLRTKLGSLPGVMPQGISLWPDRTIATSCYASDHKRTAPGFSGRSIGSTSSSAAGSATVTGCPLRWKTARGTCASQAMILLLCVTRRTIMYRDHDTETSF
jgi:tetratricopeptide (TPR) repeat protein